MQEFPIAEVHWGDAWIDSKDYSLKDAQQLKPIQRKTVGYLVSETDEAIILVTDLYTEEKDKETVNTPMVIPLGMISEWYQIGN
tara:strand:- start:443 stop:694 length:252 start_codon:yes stop_codon:yes gene_type:complete